ncbi:MAG TPA: HNH endonuclease signature motif containing protein [Polyangiaceae bacterium]|nr:HNH endonuclease signature motif containing protein [Polyangiaceae bacterium]
MGDQFRLVDLGNSELLAGLSELVRQGNALTAQMLAHLVELEERLLHLELGFSSLFSYCVEALGMSEGAAGRRVTAARVCRRYSEAFEHIARGDLHLCALCALAPHLTIETASELFEACRGKSRRQIEELLAARFPRADVREQIRRLPTRAQGPAVTAQAPPPAGTAEAASRPMPPQTPVISANSQTVSAGTTVSDRPPRALEIEPLSAERFGVHFTADAELRELIERARALARHRIPNGDLGSLMKLMAASFVRQEEKRRFGLGAKPCHRRAEAENVNVEAPAGATRETPPGGVSESAAAATQSIASSDPVVGQSKHSRYLPKKVRREAHERDRGRCAFVAADGRRCNARAFLEFDHIQPLARRGKADVANIRLLCRAHNHLHARHCFGARHLAAKIAAKKALALGPADRPRFLIEERRGG